MSPRRKNRELRKKLRMEKQLDCLVSRVSQIHDNGKTLLCTAHGVQNAIQIDTDKRRFFACEKCVDVAFPSKDAAAREISTVIGGKCDWCPKTSSVICSMCDKAFCTGCMDPIDSDLCLECSDTIARSDFPRNF